MKPRNAIVIQIRWYIVEVYRAKYGPNPVGLYNTAERIDSVSVWTWANDSLVPFTNFGLADNIRACAEEGIYNG